MLNRQFPTMTDRTEFCAFTYRQGGVVLIISLIILLALTLGGIALVRSVDTTNQISGNLAFQQSATRSGEAGTEDAIHNFLEATIMSALQNNDFSKGYAASTPATGSTATWWDSYWTSTINPNPVSRPVTTKTCVDHVCTLKTDATGNTVSYTIHRLCQNTGDPKELSTGCAVGIQTLPTSGGALCSDCAVYDKITQYYYRITTRIVGPRNTVSYIQTIVAR